MCCPSAGQPRGRQCPCAEWVSGYWVKPCIRLLRTAAQETEAWVAPSEGSRRQSPRAVPHELCDQRRHREGTRRSAVFV